MRRTVGLPALIVIAILAGRNLIPATDRSAFRGDSQFWQVATVDGQEVEGFAGIGDMA